MGQGLTAEGLLPRLPVVVRGRKVAGKRGNCPPSMATVLLAGRHRLPQNASPALLLGARAWPPGSLCLHHLGEVFSFVHPPYY